MKSFIVISDVRSSGFPVEIVRRTRNGAQIQKSSVGIPKHSHFMHGNREFRGVVDLSHSK